MAIRAWEIVPASSVRGFGTLSKSLLKLNFFRGASQNVRDTKRYSFVIRQKTSQRVIAVAVISGKDRSGNLFCAPMSPPTVYIEYLAVIPRLQCLGLGGVLLDHVIQTQSPKSKIQLHCYSTRHVGFQTKHGFTVSNQKDLHDDDETIQYEMFYSTKSCTQPSFLGNFNLPTMNFPSNFFTFSCSGVQPDHELECDTLSDDSLKDEPPHGSKGLPDLATSTSTEGDLQECVAM